MNIRDKPRSVRADHPAVAAMRWVLRLGVAGIMAGAAFHSIADGGDALRRVLTEIWKLSPDAAAWIDRSGAVFGAIMMISALARPARGLMLAAAGWLTLLAASEMSTAAEYRELTLLSRACQMALPVALALVIPRGGRELSRRRISLMERICRGAAAAVYIANGLMALYGHREFNALIDLTRNHLLGTTLNQTTISWLMPAIGAMNLMMATALMAGRLRLVLTYMTGWSLVCAASRITAHGPSALPWFFMSLGDVAAPLALLVYLECCRRYRGM